MKKKKREDVDNYRPLGRAANTIFISCAVLFVPIICASVWVMYEVREGSSIAGYIPIFSLLTVVTAAFVISFYMQHLSESKTVLFTIGVTIFVTAFTYPLAINIM